MISVLLVHVTLTLTFRRKWGLLCGPGVRLCVHSYETDIDYLMGRYREDGLAVHTADVMFFWRVRVRVL